MSTPLTWKAFDIYSTLFQNLWSFPTQWNPSTQEMIYTSSPRKLKVWLALFIFVAFPAGLGATAFILLKRLYSPDNFLTTLESTATIGYFILNFFYISTTMLVFFPHGDYYCKAFNELKKMEAKLELCKCKISKINVQRF